MKGRIRIGDGILNRMLDRTKILNRKLVRGRIIKIHCLIISIKILKLTVIIVIKIAKGNKIIRSCSLKMLKFRLKQVILILNKINNNRNNFSNNNNLSNKSNNSNISNNSNNSNNSSNINNNNNNRDKLILRNNKTIQINPVNNCRICLI